MPGRRVKDLKPRCPHEGCLSHILAEDVPFCCEHVPMDVLMRGYVHRKIERETIDRRYAYLKATYDRLRTDYDHLKVAFDALTQRREL
jgi:hypothetical protein